MNKLPIYEIFIDLDDETTFMDYNAIVDHPAHGKKVNTFKKSKPKKYHFDDERQIVIGVAISADTLIYRNDPEMGEHNVVFTKPNITKIIEQYSRNGYWNNLNIEHDQEDKVENSFMLTSYQIDSAIGMTAPELFSEESDGTWIIGYKINDFDAYQKAKTGGFSIEGVFYQQILKMSKGVKGDDLTNDQFNKLMKIIDVLSVIA